MLIFLLIWRLIIFFLAHLAGSIWPYLGNFAYVKDLPRYHLPPWLLAWANFDGLYYLRIAEHSYQQYEQAFFPLFPLVIRSLKFFTANNALLAGILIANCSLLGALVIFRKLLIKIAPQASNWPIFLLLLFPTAFFLGAVYSESLFLLLVVLTLTLIVDKRYGLAALTAYFAALTRLMGLFLFVPLLLPLLNSSKHKPLNWHYLALPLAPIAGLLTYMTYLYWSVGDPWAFFHSQSVFGEARSTQLVILPQVIYRYLKIFVTADWSHQYLVALIEFLTFAMVLTILLLDFVKQWHKKNRLMISINLFSLVNILLPALTGSLLSIPRFSLLSLSFFIYLGSLKSTALKTLIALIFALGQILLLTLFIQGYFVS